MKTIAPLRKRSIFTGREKRASDRPENLDPIWRKMNLMMEKFKEEAIKHFVCRKP